jgi:hypothetical protein
MRMTVLRDWMMVEVPLRNITDDFLPFLAIEPTHIFLGVLGIVKRSSYAN